MKSQVARVSKAVFTFVLAVVVACSLTPLPQGRAYAEGGSLVASQDSSASIAADAAEVDAPATDVPAADTDAPAADTAAADGSAADADTVTDSVTMEPPVKYSGVGVTARGKTQGAGWGAWVGSGATIGTTGGKGLNAMQLKLKGVQGLSGAIYYRTYKRGAGWKALVSDGATTGSVRNVEAVKVKLTGDVAKHYDVLYRTYVSGKGWQPWVKNNAKSGVTGKKVRVNAVQVKLSPKTEEAAGKSVESVGVRYEARFKTTGWQAWKGDGKTAGKASGSKVLTGFDLQADAAGLGGGVQYRAYNVDKQWSAWVTSGFAGKTSKRLEAMQVQLTGELSEKYDVYYRAYSQGAGWLDWAKDGATAGSTGYNLRLQAFQVKLVAKGGSAPGATQYPTVNLMEKTKTLNGIDIASYQAGINISKVKADFVIVKATQGNWYTNPYFTKHADATLKAGKLLGIYHYADLRGSAKSQAKYFIKRAKPYLGKAVLFLDYEADILSINNTVAWAKKFMDYVYKKTGVKPLIYLSQSATWAHNWTSVAKKYQLWLAQYLYANEYKSGYLNGVTHWSIGYWGSETIYQYSSTAKIKGYSGRLDVNKFYGSVLSWKKLASKS